MISDSESIKDSFQSRRQVKKLGFGPLKLVPFRDISAIVSKVSRKEFDQSAIDKNVKDIRWLSKAASKHEEVNDFVNQRMTPLPLKLCTVFQSESKVVQMLKKNYALFSLSLKELDGKAEFGVSAEMTNLTDEMIFKEKRQYTLIRKIKSASPGRAYFLRKNLIDQVSEERNKKARSVASSFYGDLKKISERSILNPPVALESAKSKMILNAAFLVSRGKIKRFLHEFDMLKADHVDDSLSFRLTGPWPPYNFVN